MNLPIESEPLISIYSNHKLLQDEIIHIENVSVKYRKTHDPLTGADALFREKRFLFLFENSVDAETASAKKLKSSC